MLKRILDIFILIVNLQICRNAQALKLNTILTNKNTGLTRRSFVTTTRVAC